MAIAIPQQPPELLTSPSAGPISEVDCPKLPWWFIDPHRDRWRLSAHWVLTDTALVGKGDTR